MAYSYRSRRTAKKLAKKSKQNFIISLILIFFLFYVTIKWLLPNFINSLLIVRNKISPTQKITASSESNPTSAPPVLNIPYEATNTAQINIKGYGTPNSKVAIFLEDEKKDIVDVSEDGSFEIKNLTLALGTNNIYGKSIDEEGKESLPSKAFKIYYDNEKPALTVNEPEDGKKVTGGDKKIKISGKTEIGVKVIVNDNQVIVDKDGNFSDEQNLNEGDNNFNTKAIDQATNTTEISRKVIYSP